MFVTVIDTSARVRYVNTAHIAQVIESHGVLEVHFPFAVGDKGRFVSFEFSIKDDDSKKALIAALAIEELPLSQKEEKIKIASDAIVDGLNKFNENMSKILSRQQ